MWGDLPLLSSRRNELIDQRRQLAVSTDPAPFHHPGGDVYSHRYGWHSFQAGLKLGARGLSVMNTSATKEINRKRSPSLAAHHQARADFQMRALI